MLPIGDSEIVTSLKDDTKIVATSMANKKVELSALGEILLRRVVKKVDNAKITSNATI